jgi:UDP-N-acetylmuramoyl-L-alanyl-D-glutamate--2,6-diaminopimelate ligase
LLILTSDNPRSECPEDILADMQAGLTPDEKERTETVVDRREAIRRAVAAANPGDVILIAGKGHETTQTIGAEVFHFDDREEVRKALGLD